MIGRVYVPLEDLGWVGRGDAYCYRLLLPKPQAPDEAEDFFFLHLPVTSFCVRVCSERGAEGWGRGIY